MPDRGISNRPLLAIAVFAAGFAVGIDALGRFAPVPEPPMVAARLAEFDAEHDRYDTLFIGSSRIFRGVDPVAFDAQTAALGRPTRSFNLAFPAMKPHEANALLRRVLRDHRPANLETVLIELDNWAPDVPDPLPDEAFVNVGRFSARAVSWHDGPETWSVLHSIRISSRSWRDKLQLAGTTFAHWGARTLHVGDAAAAIRRASAGDPANPPSQLPSRRGFTPFTENDYVEGPTSIFRRHFVRAVGAYEKSLVNRRLANAAPRSLETYNLPALEGQIAALRAAGLTPVYVLPPRGDATPQLYQLWGQGFVPVLLEFGDPEEHPALFATENRFDQQHLKPMAAQSFSRRLAERYVAWKAGR